jgi:succinoglycan biosynthesis transport protein ExoP
MQDIGRGQGRDRSRSGSEEQSLVRYYQTLRERRWLIVACTVLALVAAGVYVKVATRTYQATAEMEVQAASPDEAVLSTLPVLRQTGDPTEDVLTGASYVTTLTVATAVVHALHLKMSPSAALGDISSSPIGQASLVAVVASASSPQLAQSLANEFVQQTIVTTTATMHAQINAELPLLQTQLLTIPPNQRSTSALDQTIEEYQLLQKQPNPTLVSQAPAALPTSPSSPKTKLTLIAGLFAGLLLGVGAAFAFHALDPRLRREEQLRDLLDLPVLARIPRERKRSTLPLLPTDLSIAAQEGFRTLRTTITARGSSGESNSYLVTGSAPAEGKSTTAISLALAFAQGGRRVILIEADLRKPTFATVFGLKSFYGVEQVLIGEVDLAHALEPVRLDGTSMRVLAAHQSGAELADRMSFAIVRKLINDAKSQADVVVIDSPPLTEVIDALPFAQLADEVVIVARLDYSRLNRLVELDELLSQHGAAASGLVLVGETQRRQYYYASVPTDRPIEPPPRRSSRPAADGRELPAPQPERSGS